jgi:PleD family two-component response regulator
MSAVSDIKADILIVDDTPANLNVLSAILSKQGYRVRPAINGDLALKAAQKAPPDLILLDIQMPGMNGYEVCRQLKSDERTRHVSVIFISALEDALDKVEAFQVGGVDYITKPFQIEEVLARVENQLALRWQRAAIAALRALPHELAASLDALIGHVEALLANGDRCDRSELLAQIADLARQMQSMVAATATLTVEERYSLGDSDEESIE